MDDNLRTPSGLRAHRGRAGRALPSSLAPAGEVNLVVAWLKGGDKISWRSLDAWF